MKIESAKVALVLLLPLFANLISEQVNSENCTPFRQGSYERSHVNNTDALAADCSPSPHSLESSPCSRLSRGSPRRQLERTNFLAARNNLIDDANETRQMRAHCAPLWAALIASGGAPRASNRSRAPHPTRTLTHSMRGCVRFLALSINYDRDRNQSDRLRSPDSIMAALGRPLGQPDNRDPIAVLAHFCPELERTVPAPEKSESAELHWFDRNCIKMIDVKYSSYSLLYGQSLLWIVFNLFVPLHLLPDLTNCKCQYAVDRLPLSRLVVKYVTVVRHNALLRFILNSIFMSVQMIYIAIYLICNFSMTADSLAKFGSKYPESLTYKVLYNAPILSNGCLLVITIINMFDYEDHLWRIYDDFDTLSVNYDCQAWAAKFAILVTVPESLINIIGTTSMAAYISDSHYYKHLFFNQMKPSTRLAWQSFLYTTFILMGLTNILVRYKPVLVLMYTSICTNKHLANINSQLSVRLGARARDENPNRAQMAQMKMPGNQYENSRLKRFDIYGNRASLAVSVGDLKQRSSLSPSLANDLSQDTQSKNTEQQAVENQFTMNNLYELERHLTRLSHFIYDIDRLGSENILAVTAVNFMAYFFLVFHLAFTSSWATFLMFLGSCFARTLPLTVMFLAGNRIEEECKQMTIKLESMYLEHRSQCLIYKQMASSQLSLARILKVLESIRLNCQGLMRVNAATLKKCFIYLISIIVIVVQYDAILFINTK
jgi:hypothetical protein